MPNVAPRCATILFLVFLVSFSGCEAPSSPAIPCPFDMPAVVSEKLVVDLPACITKVSIGPFGGGDLDACQQDGQRFICEGERGEYRVQTVGPGFKNTYSVTIGRSSVGHTFP